MEPDAPRPQDPVPPTRGSKASRFFSVEPAPNTLRIHFSLLAGVLLSYIGIGAAYWNTIRLQDAVNRMLDTETAVLTTLAGIPPQLRALGRSGGRPPSAEGEFDRRERARIALELRRSLLGLDELAVRKEDRATLRRMRREVLEYLARLEERLGPPRAGRARDAAGEEADARSQDRLEAMIQLLVETASTRVAELRSREGDQRRGATRILLFLGLAGLGFLLVLLVLLSIFVTRPLVQLASRAQRWSVGGSWPPPLSHASREIRVVDDRLRQMVGRLADELAAERALADFRRQLISSVAHEVNNALTAISGAAAVISEIDKGGKSLKSREDYSDMLRANVRSLSLEMTNLLEMGKGESGRFEVRVQRVDCRRMALAAIDRLGLLGARKGILFEEAFEPDARWVAADPAALALVVTNLIGNAIKYTPAHGRIEVGAGAEGGKARLFVKDTGIGIAPEDRERILAGYYRTAGGQAAAKGFGIGLHLAQSLLNAHDSALAIESEPGKGSTFSFLLPLCPPGAAP